MGDDEGTLQIEYDDISMKAKLFLIRSWGTFGTLRFVEKSFYNTLQGFKPFWVNKPVNASQLIPQVSTLLKKL